MASRQYEKYKDEYEKNWITEESLARLVELNRKRSSIGITAEEYEEITGQKYERAV